MIKDQGQHLGTVVFMQVSGVSTITLITPGNTSLLPRNPLKKACLRQISVLKHPELNI